MYENIHIIVGYPNTGKTTAALKLATDPKNVVFDLDSFMVKRNMIKYEGKDPEEAKVRWSELYIQRVMSIVERYIKHPEKKLYLFVDMIFDLMDRLSDKEYPFDIVIPTKEMLDQYIKPVAKARYDEAVDDATDPAYAGYLGRNYAYMMCEKSDTDLNIVTTAHLMTCFRFKYGTIVYLRVTEEGYPTWILDWLNRGRVPYVDADLEDTADTTPGYHKDECCEPFIWEPEDWTKAEWKTLCDICGLPADKTERIVLHATTLEYFISDGEDDEGE